MPPGQRPHPRPADHLAVLGLHLDRVRRTLDASAADLRHLTGQIDRLTEEIATHTHTITLHQKAAAVLTGIADTRQADTQHRIETLVTQGLRTIFGEDLSFHLVSIVRAKRPEVDLVVRSTLDNGTVVDTDVIDARGGGLAAVVGFLLNVVLLLLTAPRDAPLLLDETFAHLSAEYEPRVAEFLRQLVDHTGVQIVMVTHSDAYTDLADVRYRFTLRNGLTHVTAV